MPPPPALIFCAEAQNTFVEELVEEFECGDTFVEELVECRTDSQIQGGNVGGAVWATFYFGTYA